MDIKLKSQLSIRFVGELKEELDTALEVGEDIVLDVSKVESIDTSALQLLVAFKQQVAVQSLKVEWHKPSDAFLATVKLMGLQEILS